MAKLTQLKGPIAVLPARIRFVDDTVAAQSRTRDRRNEWRAWYKLPRWCAVPHGLRWRILVRDMFMCRNCQRIQSNSSQLVADHIIPHRGDEALFWDEHNLQCLCAPCHNSTKQREEASMRTSRWGGRAAAEAADAPDRRPPQSEVFFRD